MSGPMVPAGPARAHVLALIGDGMTQAAICRATDTSSALVNSLLHGQYNAGRTPVLTIRAATADRILAVRHEPKPEPELCVPGRRFTPVGHQVGHCDLCGQLAPLYSRTSGAGPVMIRHPRALPDAPAPAAPQAVTRRHPDCGTPRGYSRHKREKTEVCDVCKAARRGYDQGMEAAIARARREAASDVPKPLAEAVVKACRAIAYRRPVPQLRALALQVVRIADAELTDDDTAVAA